MNRIRKYKNKYQVLITPHDNYNFGLEKMFGHWTDDHLKCYHIKEFSSMEDAMEEAFKYPELNWYKLVEFHKDIFVKLRNIIRSELVEHDFIVEFEAKIMEEDQLKHTMFERVARFGKRFQLNYNLNDIIGYHVVNPWGKNLKEICNILKNNADLRIVRKEYSNGVIRMVGETDIGTNYEIVLWPTLVAQWARWVIKHPEVPEQSKEQSLKDILTTQEQIEKTINIR